MTKTRIHRLLAWGGGVIIVYESVLMQNCHDYSTNLMLIFTCTYSASPLQGTNFVVWWYAWARLLEIGASSLKQLGFRNNNYYW